MRCAYSTLVVFISVALSNSVALAMNEPCRGMHACESTAPVEYFPESGPSLLISMKTEVEIDPANGTIGITTEPAPDAGYPVIDIGVMVFVLRHTQAVWHERLFIKSDSGKTTTKFNISSDEFEDPSCLTIAIYQYWAGWFDVKLLDPAKDPLKDPDPSADSVVFVIPGVLGGFGFTSGVPDLINESARTKGKIDAVVWDWTQLREAPDFRRRILINDQMAAVGHYVALRLKEWRKKNQNKKAYIVGLSAGTIITALVCEARDRQGQPILPPEFFERVVFLSGALDVHHCLTDVDRCSRAGIFNYYSYHDEILTASKYWVFIGFIPIFLDMHMRWPAVGRFGYHDTNPERQFVTLQLGWVRPDTDFPEGRELSGWGNNGGHLMRGCLADQYFKIFIVPLFDDQDLDDDGLPKRLPRLDDAYPTVGWSKHLHPLYDQDRRFLHKGCLHGNSN